MCVVDINKDGLDDVLVASPMFKQKYYDEGMVHVYINQNMVSALQAATLLQSKFLCVLINCFIKNLKKLISFRELF